MEMDFRLDCVYVAQAARPWVWHRQIMQRHSRLLTSSSFAQAGRLCHVSLVWVN